MINYHWRKEQGLKSPCQGDRASLGAHPPELVPAPGSPAHPPSPAGHCRQPRPWGNLQQDPSSQVNRFISLCRVLLCSSAPRHCAQPSMLMTAYQVSCSQLCSEPASKCSTLQITLSTTTVFASFPSPNNGLTLLDCLLTLQRDNEIQNITAAQNPFLLFWVSLLIQRAIVKCRERKKGTKARDEQKQASQ